MIDKTYQPAEVEGRIYAAWEAAGAFRAGRPERAGAAAYSIVIPPPNVTGSLHMGHALNNTLQDILARFERMRGKDVLWQPGTDHAGIATQMVVERQMMERQEPGRRDIGRDKFLEKVWAWKAESGGTIVKQLKRLGASCDWSRERFTMDEGLSRAVLKVFVTLYNDGLIYKDKRLVNWDPKLLTAISDLEVQQVEVRGHLWHIKYPILGEKNRFITVATTRPETMLGDMAVAVHPNDERYKELVGKEAMLPLANRPIAIIADEYSDPEKGTGAVKITPAHDFNDFEVWKRYVARISDSARRRFEDEVNYRDINDLINIFTAEAKLKSSAKDDLEGSKRATWPMPDHIRDMVKTESDETLSAGLEDFTLIPEEFRGLDRIAARKRIVERLEAEGFLQKTEPHTHVVPHGDRSNVVIEPYLTDQWYVDAKKLAEPAIAAVREGKTAFVPKNWEKTYFDWMENIQPWCISRQLWWGHQIPAWYGPDGEIFARLSEVEAVAAAAAHYESKGRHFETDLMPLDGIDYAAGLRNGRYKLHRDEDVLDTWFSSALWPFSTLGWPDATPEVKRFYPTAALVTGFDIIFFWVARMMMMGLHFMKEVPFKDVYIHRLVRDEKGAKMSKSKGNVVDPLGIIDDFGADALRFTLARGAAQGHDIRLSPQTVENNRNFATKLWNAARFVEFNGAGRVVGFDPKNNKETLNRWIAHETAKAVREVTEAIEQYRFNDAANAAYRFVWNVYCDWYVELSKPLLTGPDGAAKDETRATAAWALDEILKLLHPFMPFITEELWRVMASKQATITRKQLAAELASGHKMPKKKVEAVLEDFAGLITKHLKKGERINIPGFGSLVAEERAARMGRNPATGKPTQIKASKKVRFSPFTKLKEAMSSPSSFDREGSLVMLSQWSTHDGLDDPQAEAEIGWLIDLVTAIRSVRVEMNIPASTPIPVVLAGTSAETRARAGRWTEFAQRLARLGEVTFADAAPQGSVQLLVRGEVAALPLKGVIDFAAERVRLNKEMAKAESDIARVDQKLNNPKFIANAAEDIVEGEKEKREEAEARRGKIVEALERLSSAQ